MCFFSAKHRLITFKTLIFLILKVCLCIIYEHFYIHNPHFWLINILFAIYNITLNRDCCNFEQQSKINRKRINITNISGKKTLFMKEAIKQNSIII